MNVPQISEEMKAKLDKPITKKEIGDALFDLANNKCPSTDGLDSGFYKLFYHKLQDLLYNVFMEVVEKTQLHLSARQSVISLLEKIGHNPLQLTCWRPLSILNTDNKLFRCILTKKLQLAINEIVHHSRQGFIKGRYMTENILKIQQIMQHCEETQTNGLLISFDFSPPLKHSILVQNILKGQNPFLPAHCLHHQQWFLV